MTPSFITSRPVRIGAAAGALALAAMLLIPSSADAAGAATVSVTAGQLTFTAAAGQTNSLFISPEDGSKVRLDDVVGLTPGNGCVADSPMAVSCSGATFLKIALGDGNDALTKYSNLPSELDGGPGDDSIVAGPALWDVSDMRGNTLLGGDGNDVLIGGPDLDYLDGGPGADEMAGGGGWDTVTYANRTAPVTADIDGMPNDDGELGEGDSISADVDTLYGGSGNDVLTGSIYANYLFGFGGNDTLNGLAGDDVLYGGVGSDTLNGAAGQDQLFPGPGKNSVSGGDDSDYVNLTADGATAADTNIVNGGNGDDSIVSGLGADRMIGGAGVDSVSYDQHPAGVNVDIDSQIGDDGSVGEGDTVNSDIENLTGSQHDDVLILSDAANTVYAGSGDDIIKGLGGNDTLLAGSGDDTVTGGDGDDKIWGDSGDDVLKGNAGADTLIGADGYDVLDGGLDSDACNIGTDGGTLLRCESTGPASIAAPLAPVARTLRPLSASLKR